MLHRPFFRLLLGCFLLTPLGAAALQYRAAGPGVDSTSGVRIEVFSFYEEVPRHGFAPVRVTIDNRTGRERTWSVSFNSSGSWDRQDVVSYEIDLAVPAGEAKRFDLLVPLVQTADYAQLIARFYGHGIRQSERQVNFASGGYRTAGTMNAVTMSSSLTSRNWRLISDAIGGGINGSPFDLALTPVTWRGFAGMDQVWMTDEDWLKIHGAEKTALMDWVALGGRLFICREDDGAVPLPHLAGLGPENPVDHGLGTVRHWPREGDAVDVAATSGEIQKDAHVTSKQRNLEDSYRSPGWKPLADLPAVRMRNGLLLSFLVLFALLIGPVNLYVFAGGTRRYRLFWTTPALSAGASLFIFLLILLQDGVGGRGEQVALWTHFPAENKAAFIQEQVSRTALLTDRTFKTEHQVALSPINTRSIGSLTAGHMKAGHRAFGGDYFRNRSVQGHLVEGVVATRWRIERASRANGDAPTLLSTFPFPLTPLYYIDEENNHWHIAELQPGVAQPLERVSQEDFLGALDSVPGGPILERKIEEQGANPAGRFFAFAENAAEATEKTLDSIRWQSRSLHIGPIHYSQP